MRECVHLCVCLCACMRESVCMCVCVCVCAGVLRKEDEILTSVEIEII